jgi:hypothetical protein
MLDSLKIYLGMDILDATKDNLLNLLLSMAQDDIIGHCLLDTFPTGLDNAAIKLAAVYYKKRPNEGYSQQSQGSRSASISNQIPIEIQNMIASYRKIRVRG